MADASKKLQELYVVVGKNSDGQEGVASYIDPRDKIMKPAVGGESRVPELLMIGRALVEASGRELVLTRWSSRENLKVLAPEEDK